MQRKVVGAFAVALVLAASSCGGSDRPGDTNGAPQAKTRTPTVFTAQADAICTRAIRRAREMSTKGSDPLVEEMIAYERVKVAGLEKLAPPAELAASFRQYQQVMAARRDLFEQYRANLLAKRSTKPLVSKGKRLEKQEARLGKTLGLTSDCGG